MVNYNEADNIPITLLEKELDKKIAPSHYIYNPNNEGQFEVIEEKYL